MDSHLSSPARHLRALLDALFWGSRRARVLKLLFLIAWVSTMVLQAGWEQAHRDFYLRTLLSKCGVAAFALYAFITILGSRREILLFHSSLIFLLFSSISYLMSAPRELTLIALICGLLMMFTVGLPSLYRPRLAEEPSLYAGLVLLILGTIMLALNQTRVITGFEAPISAVFTAGSIAVANGLRLATLAPILALERIDVHRFRHNHLVLYRFLIYLKNGERQAARGARAKLVMDLEGGGSGSLGNLVIADRRGGFWERCRRNGVDCPLKHAGHCCTQFLSPHVKSINDYLPWLSAIPLVGSGGIFNYHVNTILPGAEEAVGVFELWRLSGSREVVVRFYSEQGIEVPERPPQPRICFLVDRFPVAMNFKVTAFADNADPFTTECVLAVRDDGAELECNGLRLQVPLTSSSSECPELWSA